MEALSQFRMFAMSVKKKKGVLGLVQYGQENHDHYHPPLLRRRPTGSYRRVVGDIDYGCGCDIDWEVGGEMSWRPILRINYAFGIIVLTDCLRPRSFVEPLIGIILLITGVFGWQDE